MGGPENVKIHILNLVEARHIVSHIAIRGRDNSGRPAHNVIAAEEGVFFGQGKAHMRMCVTRRVDGLQRPAGPRKGLTATQFDIRRKIRVVF